MESAFSERQLTALSTFSALLTDIVAMAKQDGANDEYAEAIRTYIALAIGRLVNANSTFARWQATGDFVAGPFDMATLSMLWDFAESNPFCASTQNWMAQIEWVSKVLERLPSDVNSGVSHHADASTTVHAENGPVIVTDPPTTQTSVTPTCPTSSTSGSDRCSVMLTLICSQASGHRRRRNDRGTTV